MKNKDYLVVSETFYSIQGEGQTMGYPAVFLRLAGCNLLCQSDSWKCDSIEVWQKGVKTHFSQIITDDNLLALKAGAHLVITGGEPLLHQEQIARFLMWFQHHSGWLPVIEIETNGTIIPFNYLMNAVKYWNVSPKLKNSGETYSRRVKLEAIEYFKNMNSIFKFVVEKEQDVLEMSREYSLNDVYQKIYLMPAGASQEELNITRPIVAELCKKYSYKYSERLHIGIWDKKTGV